MATTDKSAAVVKANEKGKIRLECAAAVHLMRKGLIDECVRKGWVGRRTCCKTAVGGYLLWTIFIALCVFAWQTRWFTWGDLKRLREYSVAVGQAHVQL